MKLSIKQIKQIIKEELQEVTADTKPDEHIATVLESIDWVIEYHKGQLQIWWESYGPYGPMADEPEAKTFIIDHWKGSFNNPENRYIDLRAISRKFNFFDDWLYNRFQLRRKLIDAIFATTEWQDFHNETLKMIEVIDAASKGNLNLGPKLDELVVSGMKNNDLSMVRTAVTLAVDLGLL